MHSTSRNWFHTQHNTKRREGITYMIFMYLELVVLWIRILTSSVKFNQGSSNTWHEAEFHWELIAFASYYLFSLFELLCTQYIQNMAQRLTHQLCSSWIAREDLSLLPLIWNGWCTVWVTLSLVTVIIFQSDTNIWTTVSAGGGEMCIPPICRLV